MKYPRTSQRCTWLAGVGCMLWFAAGLAPGASAQTTRVADVAAFGWPNERLSNNRPAESVDGNLSTYTWTTEAYNTQVGHLGLDFGGVAEVCRIRLWKDPSCGDGIQSLPKDLLIQYTADVGEMASRTRTPVSQLTNGWNGTEFMDANAVNPDGTVSADIHDSVDGDGWASLTFAPVLGTGISIRFDKTEGTTFQYIHYKVYEFEAYALDDGPGPDPIPEPTTIALLSLAAVVGYALGRRTMGTTRCS